MSNFKRITRKPDTGEFKMAEWWDDYYGAHQYAVKWDDDARFWPVEMVNKAELKEFWVQDVIDAFYKFLPADHQSKRFDDIDKALEAFLEEVNKAYKARWKRDKVGGEGAVENLQKKRGK